MKWTRLPGSKYKKKKRWRERKTETSEKDMRKKLERSLQNRNIRMEHMQRCVVKVEVRKEDGRRQREKWKLAGRIWRFGLEKEVKG